MADEGIRIKIELNADMATESLGNLLGFIESGELMKMVGTEVAKFSRNRILSHENTAPDGSKWEPLSLAYLLGKKKTHPHQGTLQRENSLYRALRADNATKDHVEVGSSLVYTLIHQFGGKAGRGRKVTIPARPYS